MFRIDQSNNDSVTATIEAADRWTKGGSDLHRDLRNESHASCPNTSRMLPGRLRDGMIMSRPHTIGVVLCRVDLLSKVWILSVS